MWPLTHSLWDARIEVIIFCFFLCVSQTSCVLWPFLFLFILLSQRYQRFPYLLTTSYGNTFKSCLTGKQTTDKGWQECNQAVSQSFRNASGKRPPHNFAPPTARKHHLASVCLHSVSGTQRKRRHSHGKGRTCLSYIPRVRVRLFILLIIHLI